MNDLQPYVMVCPHCKRTLKFGSRAIGKTKDCPGCARPVVIAPDELPNPGHEHLRGVVRSAKCRVVGWEDAGNDAHRSVLAVLIQGFGEGVTILCEPSLARKAKRPPDIVLVDPKAGLHVFEVKGMALDAVLAVEGGGQFRIRYGNGVQRRKPLHQVNQAMFDIKDSISRLVRGNLHLPLKVWVVMPQITRAAWMTKWAGAVFCPEEFLFADDMEPAVLAARILAMGQDQLATWGLTQCPEDQLQCVWRAFGDTSVLYQRAEDRQARETQQGTLGQRFDQAAQAYKELSDEQQRLCMQDWTGAPRLVRGVAGSGKTIVLATNLARRYHRESRQQPDLFEPKRKPNILAVCFNRTLAPYILQKIEIAYEQRSGERLAPKSVHVFSFNKLMYFLGKRGLWTYQHFRDEDNPARAARYLDDLAKTKANNPELYDSLAYDAIYVDEGQDFVEEEFRLLKELCRTPEGGEPNLYVFYDDAQNLYARGRPNWQSLGINVRGGRSHIMTECSRNTRQIVEPAFNVLYGSFATVPGQVPTKEYSDIGTLEEKGLVRNNEGVWQVRFTKREGLTPRLTLAASKTQETAAIIARLRHLIEEQQVRPEDVQVLSLANWRIEELAHAIEAAKLPSVTGVHLAFKDRDHAFGRKGHLSLSTAASAKGYDAYCVLLASANTFDADLLGRVSFYVACTRAIEYLEVFAYERRGLVVEMETALAGLAARSCDPLDRIGDL